MLLKISRIPWPVGLASLLLIQCRGIPVRLSKTTFVCLAILVVAGFACPQFAAADIIGINNPPSTPCSGGVICQGGSPIDLSAVLNGTVALNIPPNGTPEWELVNNLGANYSNNGTTTNSSGVLTQLTLFFSGSLASNAFLDLQVNGWSASTNPFTGCEIVDSASPSHAATGCSVNSLEVMNGFTLPAELIWSMGTGHGVSSGGDFDIKTASFAHAGQDVGCISGSSTCTPMSAPEPSGLALLGASLLGFVAVVRRHYSI